MNLLPYSVYLQLGLGELKPTTITLQLADRSMNRPREIIEDVLMKVDKFYIPVDFIVIDTEQVHDVMNQILVILGRPFLAMTSTLINCRTGVMKISFGNTTMELNIFYINNQPLDYDEIRPVFLIEEITDEFSLKGPEIEYFTQDEDDLDLDRLIGQDDVYTTTHHLEIEYTTTLLTVHAITSTSKFVHKAWVSSIPS